jgi:hypothetical protein
MANTQAFCTQAKIDLLNGGHAFGTQPTNSVRTVTTKDTFNLALYLASATMNASTTVYTSTGELAATGNYTAKGKLLTNATAPTSSGTTAFWTPSASVTWTTLTSSGSFDAALLINNKSTSGGVELAVSVHTFSAQSITAGDFTLTMPTNDATNGLIRIA